jgi:hypothetical protein
VYTFAAHAGDSIYVVAGPCDGAALSFDLVKPDNSVLDGAAGCHDFGPIKLPINGAYRIEARASSAPARYAFTLRSVAVDQFATRIGAVISPDHPAGAGAITQLGQRQSYSFAAQAGQIVYLAVGPCEGALPSFELRAPDDHLVGQQLGCNDLGRVVLPQTGTYHLVASSGGDATRYSVALNAVAPDQHFSVRLPLSVSPDVPTRSAGHITTRGAQQFFDFVAAEGSTVHIEGKCARPCLNLAVRAVASGDTSRLGFVDLNRLDFGWKLTAGGNYTIQVLSNGYTGDYNFSAAIAQPTRK